MYKVIILIILGFLCAADAVPLPSENDTINGQLKIVGGWEAPDGSYPYQVSIQRQGSHFCGGSIISTTTVLTAGHCLKNISPSAVTVVVGSNILYSGGTAYRVKCVRVHEHFSLTEGLSNDIALITLDEPIQFDGKVNMIPLERNEIPTGSDVMLSGWGRLRVGGRAATRLQHIPLRTISLHKCLQDYYFIDQAITRSQICTLTRKGEGACHGDSGGPLVMENLYNVAESVKLVGIVSWGNPCANGLPDVFTKVSAYYDWITTNINSCY